MMSGHGKSDNSIVPREVFEQSPSKGYGEDGGKGVGQGEDA